MCCSQVLLEGHTHSGVVVLTHNWPHRSESLTLSCDADSPKQLSRWDYTWHLLVILGLLPPIHLVLARCFFVFGFGFGGFFLQLSLLLTSVKEDLFENMVWHSIRWFPGLHLECSEGSVVF